MISGQYNHSIDPKSRMFFPAKLREELGESIVLMRGTDPCINVYPIEAWRRFSEKLEAQPQTQIRDLKRFLYSSVVELQLDAQGRVLIPQTLREYAKLEKTVVTIGVGDHAEIWDEASFNSRMDALDPADIAAKLIELGL